VHVHGRTRLLIWEFQTYILFFEEFISCTGVQFVMFLGDWGLSLSNFLNLRSQKAQRTMWASCAILWGEDNTLCESFMSCVTIISFGRS
jgi:hypothetical protein